VRGKSKKFCRFLRGKNAFGSLEGGENPFFEFDTGTTIYWCLRTMGAAGPDNGLAHISTCSNEERNCFSEPETKGKD
jgi:hypothetical protein